MAQWLSLRAFQIVHYWITLKIFFYTISCKIPYKIILNYHLLLFSIFFNLTTFKSNSFFNSLISPETKSTTHCLTESFSIYENKHWTVRRRDDHSVNLLSYRIILKIVGFLHMTYFQRFAWFGQTLLVDKWEKNYKS